MKSTLSTRIKLSAGIALAASLVACSRDVSDLNQYVQMVKAKPPAPIEPIPEIKPYVRFIYPGHELDPFDSKILAPAKAPDPESSVKPDPNRVPEFLESFPLDGLRMVGTINQNGALWALIRIPDGTVYRAKTGNYLGKNNGKILAVEETRVTLKEIVENGLGGYKERDNSIALSDPKSKDTKN
ncbi:MAG: pilus assembly protein PilP [Candidatus Thiothrix singaporensis]|uniref:Pilus assembly protein PilP n=1 Tax=Candidatus Thiothrix singaporensis TaxID=2799669 RepID=A0A7L6AT01_9GAMM|nr:MAG: pilus assembly protein PilP [Candidatus Thiothrix singaporensis]